MQRNIFKTTHPINHSMGITLCCGSYLPQESRGKVTKELNKLKSIVRKFLFPTRKIFGVESKREREELGVHHNFKMGQIR